jgi:hypothetical protein
MFARSFLLPFTPDPKQIDAVLQNGVLTIQVAKPLAAQEKVRLIPVRSGEGDAASQLAHAPPARAAKASASGEHEGAPH